MSQIRPGAPVAALAFVLGFAGVASAQASLSAPSHSPSDIAGQGEDKTVGLHAGVFSYNLFSFPKKSNDSHADAQTAGALGAGVSVGVGVHVARRTLVELDAQLAGAFGQASVSSASTSLGVRQFFGETFYLRGGVRYQRLVESDNTVYIAAQPEGDHDAPQGLRWRMIVSDVGPDLSFGNRWRWGSFTLGVDWLGAYVPVVTTAARSEEVSESTGKVVSRASVRTLASRLDLRLLHLQLGATF